MKTPVIKEISWFDKQADKFEESRFAAMTIMLTAQSCWGSIAALYSIKNDSLILLGLGAMLTMASNAAFIAQGPAKWCLGIFYASVVTNLIILLVNFV